MTVPDTGISVHRSVTVPLPRDRAFALFTARQHAFWPLSHTVNDAARADVVVEPRAGGRWFERGVDGSECEWGHLERFGEHAEQIRAVFESPDGWTGILAAYVAAA